MSITNINHITLAYTCIHRSFEFYKDVLGFKPLVKWGKGEYFLIGNFWFCLNIDSAKEPQPCYTYYAFSINGDGDKIMIMYKKQIRTLKAFGHSSSLADQNEPIIYECKNKKHLYLIF